jgi:hypothetical protein
VSKTRRTNARDAETRSRTKPHPPHRDTLDILRDDAETRHHFTEFTRIDREKEAA